MYCGLVSFKVPEQVQLMAPLTMLGVITTVRFWTSVLVTAVPCIFALRMPSDVGALTNEYFPAADTPDGFEPAQVPL